MANWDIVSDISSLPNILMMLMVIIGYAFMTFGSILFREARRNRVKRKFIIGIILLVVGVGLLFLALWLYS
jgi:hypothetical protein